MSDETFKVIGISGSLRVGSFNRLLLDNMLKMLPEWSEGQILDLNGIPVFNQELEYEQPVEVKRLKQKVIKSDLIVLATPEYNHAMSGVLKNALDWLSRPPSDNPFLWKVVAVVSASTGNIGGARAQEDLRNVMASLGAIVVPRPEVILVNADRKFNPGGELTDQVTIKLISDLLNNSIKLALAVKRFSIETLAITNGSR
ncbi:MAG: NADPH-dependent FMN reductase [Nitrososphaeria archaeon]